MQFLFGRILYIYYVYMYIFDAENSCDITKHSGNFQDRHGKMNDDSSTTVCESDAEQLGLWIY